MNRSIAALLFVSICLIVLSGTALWRENAKREAQTPPKQTERMTYEGDQTIGDYRWTFWYDHKYQWPIACVHGPGTATVCVKE